jgi:hypothetical protein
VLVTDFLVCIGFCGLWFAFCFGFSSAFIGVPVHVRKRGAPPKAATTAQFFLISFRPCCKNFSIVIQFAAAKIPL